MKFKAWLREKHNMSKTEYKALEEMEQYALWGDFCYFNRVQQKVKTLREKGYFDNARPMTEEEKAYYYPRMEKEAARLQIIYKANGYV